MRFIETGIDRAFVIELEPRSDERGFFARAFCESEFRDHGLTPTVAQANLSFNRHAGTLRGFHYQTPPASEAKLVRCIRGALYDVLVDMREDSPTYLRHFGVELSADNRRALLVPEMCAHAFQTLADDTEALYMASAPYAPGQERGLRYDDPELAISWPLPVTEISDKDAAWPLVSAVPA